MKEFNILEDIQKGISSSYLGKFSFMQNADLDTSPGCFTSQYRLGYDNLLDTADVLAARTFTGATNDICTAATNVESDWQIGQPVTLTTTGTLPAGLSTGTIYYVFWTTGMTTDQFKLASTLAELNTETPVNITDTGTGTHTVTPKQLGSEVKKFVRYEDTLFALTGLGEIWMRDTSYGETWLPIYHASAFEGIEVWKNYLIAIANNELEVFGSLSNLSTASWKTWHTQPTYTITGGFSPTQVMTDGVLYIGLLNDVASLTEVAGQTFDPTDNTTYSWNASALDFSVGNIITSLEQYGLYLALGVSNRGRKDANIYLWDTTSPSYYEGLTVDGYYIHSLTSFNGLLYFMTSDAGFFSDGSLYVSNGGTVREVAKIPISGIAHNPDNNFSLETFVVTFHRNKIYFVVSSTNTGRGGVYSYNTDTGSLNCEFIAQSLNTSNVNYNSLIFLDDDLIVSITDGNLTYQETIQRLEVDGLHRRGQSYFETGLFRTGKDRTKLAIEHIEVVLNRKLVTGQSITLYFRTNLDDAYTTIGTMSYTTDGAVYSKTLDCPIITDQVQFKVLIGVSPSGSRNLSPEIKAIYVG